MSDTTAASREDEDARRFAEKLKSVRQACDGRPEDEMRETIRQAIQAELAAVPDSPAGPRLERVRRYLVQEARRREERLGVLEAELHRLQAEFEKVRAERDRFASAGAGSRPPGGAPAGGLGQSSNAFRAGLLKVAQGQQVAPESIGLPQSEVRLFQLFAELLRFALNYEKGVLDLLQEIQVGPGMATKVINKQKKLIEERFLSCLKDEAGSIQALQEALLRNSSFLIRLHEAYSSAVKHGVETLLREIDPQAIVAQTRGMGNPQKWWSSYIAHHSDLSSLPAEDAWERFFNEAFRRRLSDYLEPGGGKS